VSRFFFIVLISFSSFSQENFVIDQTSILEGAFELKLEPFGLKIESLYDIPESFDCSGIESDEVQYVYYFMNDLKKRDILRKKCDKLDVSLGSSFYSHGAGDKKKSEVLKFYYLERQKQNVSIENYNKTLNRLNTYEAGLLGELLILHWHLYFDRVKSAKVHLYEILKKGTYFWGKDLDFRREITLLSDNDSKVRLTEIINEVILFAKSKMQKIQLIALLKFLTFFDWSSVEEQLNKKVSEDLQENINSFEKYKLNYRWVRSLGHLWDEKVKEYKAPKLKRTGLRQNFTQTKSVKDFFQLIKIGDFDLENLKKFQESLP
jgi:hypothetical protein